MFLLAALFGLLLTFPFAETASWRRQRRAYPPSINDGSYNTPYLNASYTSTLLPGMSRKNSDHFHDDLLELPVAGTREASPEPDLPTTTETSATRIETGSTTSAISTSSSSQGDQGSGPTQGATSSSSSTPGGDTGGVRKEAIIGIAVGIPSALVAVGTIIQFLRKCM